MTTPQPLTAGELATLNDALKHGTLEQRSAAADSLAQARAAVPIEFRHYASDKFWNRVGPVGADLIESTGTDPRNNVPTLTLKVKGGSDLVEHFFGCQDTMVGIEMEVGGLNFPFYVKSHDWEFQKGSYTSTLNCRGIWDVLNFLRIWPVWWMPIQIQPFSHAIFFGPLCTVIENMISECAIRIQSGINEFLNNALSGNPASGGILEKGFQQWIATLLNGNRNVATALKTPIYVVRHNPFLDTSPLYAKTVRMESCGTVITDITRPYGVDVRVDLWRPGQPQPDKWANLNQPTYVVTVTDRSQVEGPTKTILDSALRTAVDVQGSFLGNMLAPLLNPHGEYAPQGVYIAPRLGLDFVRPYIVLVAPQPGADDPRSPIVSMKVSQHTPMGWNQIIGGKSPKWLVCAPRANHLGGTDQPNNRTTSLTRSSPGSWTASRCSSELPVYQAICSQDSSMIRSWPFRSSRWSIAAQTSAPTTRASRRSPRRIQLPMTSRRCSPSSTRSGTAVVTPRDRWLYAMAPSSPSAGTSPAAAWHR